MKTRTKAQGAYEKLRRMVVQGAFSRRRWSLRRLAANLGMSVVPVSEAVRRLEQEDLLETKPQSGLRIRSMSPAELREAMLLRQALECQAIRIATVTVLPARLTKIKNLARRIARCLERGEERQAAYADFELHMALVAAAGSPLLAQKYEQVAARCMINTGSLQGIWPRREKLSSGHLKLVKALASGRPDRAERAVRHHIRAEKPYLTAEIRPPSRGSKRKKRP